ncbi:MAG: leucyl aminopeptidase [Actinomycetota bacterium]
MASLKTSADSKSEILVLGLSSKAGELSIHPNISHISSIANDTKKLLAILQDLGATGKEDEVIKVSYTGPRLILFTGFGTTAASYSHETLRRAAGAATRALAGHNQADFALPNTNSAEFAAIAEGIALGAYLFSEFRGSTKDDQKAPLQSATIISTFTTSAHVKEVLARAEILGKYVGITRNLINTPPSHLTPITFTNQMRKIATSLGIKVEVLTETQLKAKGYGGITSVGQGSANPPRLLHLTYAPTNPKKRLAFVGKGITFDSGGYALKPALGMGDMKSDMSGAAAVVAATFAIASLKLPIAIDTYACLAENMVSGDATRPSDIVTMYGGKTVEVLNPDAEGRMVMADGLVRAAQDGKRYGGLDGLIDVATLTGAQVIALGTRTSAVMANNEEFRTQFLEAAGISGESFWPMPLPEDLKEALHSASADMVNSNPAVRAGGMLIAGLFLREFVPDDIPWLHLDIAGPALTHEAHGYTPVGGTGVAVRSLVTLAELAIS